MSNNNSTQSYPCYLYIKNTAPVLYFRLDRTGRILEHNHYAGEIIGEMPADRDFQSVLLDFNANFDLDAVKISTEPQLLSIQTKAGFPASFLFFFEVVENDVLVFAHTDAKEVETIKNEMMLLNQELGNTTRALHKKNAQLKNALDHVKTLQGIIPICSFCHKIRDDQQVWERLESYLSETHRCPDQPWHLSGMHGHTLSG
jgi:PAS domain-containing protein